MNKQTLRNIFTDVLENPTTDEIVISKYFSKDYIQHVDGKTINYDGFVKHILVLMTKTKQIAVSVKSIASEGDTVFSKHEVSITLKDGKNTRIKVISEFRFRDSKVYYCDELSRMIEGDDKNKDLGSRVD